MRVPSLMITTELQQARRTSGPSARARCWMPLSPKPPLSILSVICPSIKMMTASAINLPPSASTAVQFHWSAMCRTYATDMRDYIITIFMFPRALLPELNPIVSGIRFCKVPFILRLAAWIRRNERVGVGKHEDAASSRFHHHHPPTDRVCADATRLWCLGAGKGHERLEAARRSVTRCNGHLPLAGFPIGFWCSLALPSKRCKQG